MGWFEAHSLQVELRDDGTALLWLDVPGRTHNVFNRQVLADLGAALDRLAGEPAVRLLVVLSRKDSGFVAGADLQEFKAVRGPADAVGLSAAGQDLFNKLAGVRVPTVAVVHGACLGGGLELALACDYRVVLDQPGTQLGLPEIELGLVPGWGGTQRLPRTVGIERALQVILQRRRLNATDALHWRLADAVAPTREEAIALARGLGDKARREGKRGRRPPLRTWRARLLEGWPGGRWLLFRGAERILRRRVPDDMPAPFEALRAVRVGLARGLDAGLAAEREAIGRLATTAACRNLMTLFFVGEAARKQADAEGEGAPAVRRVGVVGAGTMGAGIAQLAAVKGYDVVVREVNDAALAAGMARIEGLFQKAVERRLLSADEGRAKLAAMARTTGWDGLGEVDLTIEAVIEDLDAKRAVFRELEARARPDAILASNTSSLLVGRLEQGLQRPGRVAGLHFFNPVHKMLLVEVVRAPATEPAVVAALCRWAASLGKVPVVVKDSPGFAVNRVLMPYLNEALVLAAEGVGIEPIDRVMRRFGMPLGPFELLDQVGLDVAAHIARTMEPYFAERLAATGAATPPVGTRATFEEMARQGWVGEKAGTGFYVRRGRRKTVNPGAAALLLGGRPASVLRPEEARDRMVLLMVNEAAACLEEGVVERPELLDLAMVIGTGWAPHRGGPLRYADDRGPAKVVEALERLAAQRGPRFTPAAELRRRASGAPLFYAGLEAATGR